MGKEKSKVEQLEETLNKKMGRRTEPVKQEVKAIEKEVRQVLVRQVGNALVITVPLLVIESYGIESDDVAIYTLEEEKRVSVQFVSSDARFYKSDLVGVFEDNKKRLIPKFNNEKNFKSPRFELFHEYQYPTLGKPKFMEKRYLDIEKGQFLVFIAKEPDYHWFGAYINDKTHINKLWQVKKLLGQLDKTDIDEETKESIKNQVENILHGE